MIDGVVNDHGVEFTTEPRGAHVIKDVFYTGIALAADRQHGLLPVQQRQLGVLPKVECHASTAGTQFQNAPRPRGTFLVERAHYGTRFTLVVARRREQRPPFG